MTDRTSYTSLLHEVANRYRIPFALLEAQVLVESSGDPNALRYEADYFKRYIKANPKAIAGDYGPFAACSVGLLQVMVESAYEAGFVGRPEALFVVATNLEIGARIMASLWNQAGSTDGDYRTALAAYNGGRAMLTLAETAWPGPVQAYVSRVYAQVVAS